MKPDKPNSVYYLAHPYSGQEVESWTKANGWTFLLRQRGLIVFSPILHTHTYDSYHTLVAKTYDEQNFKEDYVKWDLGLLAGLKNPIVLMDKEAYNVSPMRLMGFYMKHIKNLNSPEVWKNIWKSQGCRKEYEFCFKHHIPVYDLGKFVFGFKKIKL